MCIHYTHSISGLMVIFLGPASSLDRNASFLLTNNTGPQPGAAGQGYEDTVSITASLISKVLCLFFGTTIKTVTNVILGKK